MANDKPHDQRIADNAASRDQPCPECDSFTPKVEFLNSEMPVAKGSESITEPHTFGLVDRTPMQVDLPIDKACITAPDSLTEQQLEEIHDKAAQFPPARRANLVLLWLYVGLIPVTIAMFFIHSIAFVGIYVGLVMIAYVNLTSIVCPTCGKQYFEGKWGSRPFSRKCSNCGTP